MAYINDETGKEIADPTSEDYEHGAPYSTKESDNIPEKFKLIETPKDATGTADKDYKSSIVTHHQRKLLLATLMTKLANQLVIQLAKNTHKATHT